MLHVRIEVPPVPEAIEAAVEGLVRLNEWFFRTAAEAGVEAPGLYESGIVYRREEPGTEWWETAADALGVVENRAGDCEDLAAYRAAELRVFEDDPEAAVRIVRTRRGTFHAIVQHGDGTFEDPSRICVALEYQRTGVNTQVR
jgi:hypothetical protein